MSLLRRHRALVHLSLALALVLAFVPGRAGLAVRIYALLVCAYAVVLATRALREEFPPAQGPKRRRARRTRARRRPPALAQAEHNVALGLSGALDLHHRLRPELRNLARERLAARRGISLDDEAQARRVLGDEAWALLRADRPPPENRFGAGIRPTELSRIVDALERV